MYAPLQQSNNDDESTIELQRQTIASLSADSSNLRRRLGVYESDLERCEQEVDRLRSDKIDLACENEDLQNCVSDLTTQVTTEEGKLFNLGERKKITAEESS